MSAVLSVRSGSTVSLCPRICPRIQIQFCVPDSLKAALALEDQFVQDPHARIQVCMPDPVGVPAGELIELGIGSERVILGRSTVIA
jgi:hypothetical protein